MDNWGMVAAMSEVVRATAHLVVKARRRSWGQPVVESAKVVRVTQNKPNALEVGVAEVVGSALGTD